jgi:hydrogenase nickel incorporation protein HypA/HybF
MHEVDMTKCLLLSMTEWKRQHAPRQPRVSTVHLQVGAFTCVEPDQLVFTWEAAVQGSWLAGARLAIEPVPLVGRCLVCSSTYAPRPEQAYRSPCCNHPMEEIVSGRELRIRSVEYALDDPPATPAATSAATVAAPPSLASPSTPACAPCA